MDCESSHPEMLDRMVKDIDFVPQQHGMSLLARGDFRAVWETHWDNDFGLPEGCVVKTQDHDRTYQNRQEVEQWEEAQGTWLENKLAPVEDHADDFSWITMPLADQRGMKQADALRKELESHGWECRDIKPENVGSIDDRVVLFDYHQGCRRI